VSVEVNEGDGRNTKTYRLGTFERALRACVGLVVTVCYALGYGWALVDLSLGSTDEPVPEWMMLVFLGAFVYVVTLIGLTRVLLAQKRSGWLATRFVITDKTCTVLEHRREAISFAWRDVATVSAKRPCVTLSDGRKVHLRYGRFRRVEDSDLTDIMRTGGLHEAWCESVRRKRRMAMIFLAIVCTGIPAVWAVVRLLAEAYLMDPQRAILVCVMASPAVLLLAHVVATYVMRPGGTEVPVVPEGQRFAALNEDE